MAEAVLDSSAVIAVVRSESGADIIAAAMPRSVICVVNEAEVISVLIRYGASPEDAVNLARELPYGRVDLDAGLARRAGMLWREMKPRGLSLGDRCCLALAEREGLPVLTSDSRWTDLPIDVEIQMFRKPGPKRGQAVKRNG